MKYLIFILSILFVMPLSAETISKLYYCQSSESNADNSTLSIRNFKNGELISSLPLSFKGGRIAVNSDSSAIWVFASDNGFCQIFSSSYDKEISQLNTEMIVAQAEFSPDGNYLFLLGTKTNSANRLIKVYDSKTQEHLYDLTDLSDPIAMAVTPDSKILFYTSLTTGMLIKIDLPSFKETESIYAGYEPVDLDLSPDGKLIFVTCQGLDNGLRGGAQITIFQVDNLTPLWIFNDLQAIPKSTSISSDFNKVIISCIDRDEIDYGLIKIYDLADDGDKFKFTFRSNYSQNAVLQNALLSPDGNFWIGYSDQSSPLLVDITSDTIVNIEYLTAGGSIALLNLDINALIAEIDEIIASGEDTLRAADLQLERAYLVRCSGDKNSMVVAYQQVVNNYPASYAAIESELSLAGICYNDQLFGKSAQYTYSALNNYIAFLLKSENPKQLPESEFIQAVERLALLSELYKKEYLKNLAKSFLKLSYTDQTFANIYFRLGYHLVKQDEKKLARKCFKEVRNQLAGINDPFFLTTMNYKLMLTSGDPIAQYKFKKPKQEIILDGDLNDWKKSKSISLEDENYLTKLAANWYGINDLSANIYLTVDETNLYLAGKIFDDSLVSGEDQQGDKVIIYLDLRVGAGSYFSRDFSIGEGCFKFEILAPTNNPKAVFVSQLQTAYQIASQSFDDHYTFEIKIPLSAFGKYTIIKDQSFGLGVDVFDYDQQDNLQSIKVISFMNPEKGPEFYGIAKM